MFSLCGQSLTNVCLKTTKSKPLKEYTVSKSFNILT